MEVKKYKGDCIHPHIVKHTRQGNQVMILHLRVPKYYCPGSGRHFRHTFVGIRPRYRSSEAYRLEVFEAHDGGVTQRKLSLTRQVSPATVERWYHHHIAQRRLNWRVAPALGSRALMSTSLRATKALPPRL